MGKASRESDAVNLMAKERRCPRPKDPTSETVIRAATRSVTAQWSEQSSECIRVAESDRYGETLRLRLPRDW